MYFLYSSLCILLYSVLLDGLVVFSANKISALVSRSSGAALQLSLTPTHLGAGWIFFFFPSRSSSSFGLALVFLVLQALAPTLIGMTWG